MDSEIWWDEVRRDFAASHDRPWTSEDQAAVMGANSRQWSHTMRKRLALPMPAEEIERAIVDGVVERYRREGAPEIAGAKRTVLRVAKERPVAVASSGHPAVIGAALDALGIRASLSAVVSSDEVERGKPEPDVFLETARRLGVAPGACLVVEDSLNGVRAARAAGMTVVLIPNASVPPAPGAAELADRVLAGLDELEVDAVGAATGRE